MIWGLFPLYFHHLKGVGSFEIAALRVVTTALMVWAVLLIKRDTAWIAKLRDQKTRVRLVLAGMAITANWLIYVWAVANDHVVDAAIGYYINPLVTVAVGVVVLRERLRNLQKVAAVLGAAAVMVLTIAYGKVPYIALSLALTFALYAFLKKTVGLESLSSLAAETTAMSPFALVGLIWLSRGKSGLDSLHAPATTTTLLLFIGVVTAVPLVLFGVAARRIPLAQIGLLQYLTPTMVLLLGVFVFHEKVSALRWVGMAIVWCALVALAADALSTLRSGPSGAVTVEPRQVDPVGAPVASVSQAT
jgi:chloramphenicol-sensitive protein RarD